jgi:hypothetical protein
MEGRASGARVDFARWTASSICTSESPPVSAASAAGSSPS